MNKTKNNNNQIKEIQQQIKGCKCCWYKSNLHGFLKIFGQKVIKLVFFLN